MELLVDAGPYKEIGGLRAVELLVGSQDDPSSGAHPAASRANLHIHTPKCLADRVGGDSETVADHVEREPVAVEVCCLVDVLVAELRTHSAPRNSVALEMREHCGAVDVEATGELGYRVAFHICGNQPFDVSASEPDLGLVVTACEPSGSLRVNVSSAPQIANSPCQRLERSRHWGLKAVP
jgi:hypothetical protein